MDVAEIPIRVMQRFVPDRISQLEDALVARPEAVHSAAGSPERFEIGVEALGGGTGPYAPSGFCRT